MIRWARRGGRPDPRRAAGKRALAVLASSMVLACSVGQGEGFVTAIDDLYVDNCWQGPYDLRPDFFAANPFEDTLTIRVQRGEQDISVSDGFAMLVYDVPTVRASLGMPLPIGLPVGVSPLGYPLPPVPSPPAATLTLYFNASCRRQNANLSAIDGTVWFTDLFSGDLNEENSDDRITEGRFEATVVDPRHATPVLDEAGNATYTYPEEMMSEVEGAFKFVFHRGTPAQPFP